MNAQPCPKPGLARRGGRYEEQVAACASTSVPLRLNRLMIDKALALGTAGELSCQERCLMMALLAHLDVAATAGGETAVWPGSARLCVLLGIGESTLRRLKSSLEEKGYILRRYDHLNRPLRGGAIDLKPFLLRVESLCEELGHTTAQLNEDKNALRAERYDHRLEESAPALTSERPIGNPPQETSERTPVAEEELEMVREAERLLPGIAGDPEASAEKVLGHRKAASLWPWAKRRHGERALLALAIAGTSPHIESPPAWFGWFATSAAGAEADLEGLAEKLKRSAPQQKAAPALPQELEELATAFADLVGWDKARSYLAGGSVQALPSGKGFEPKSTLSYRRLAGDLAEPFGAAAAAAGFEPRPVRPSAASEASPTGAAASPGTKRDSGRTDQC
ncbi:hypothetical protein [Parvularcula maris]|uniref:Helix-turn-helix domain-containing protein n=1 Tax=Parvularcula maris TaxID=2965077 RepID=A0A9X2LAL0_9PROT|nr:hypothetical protein [Parvularcula maris]MCQ8185998.1 hypothetical protein [Parvularcula maris]